MWTCPKCDAKVDPSFEVCWRCGTSPEGVEDPGFLRADAPVSTDTVVEHMAVFYDTVRHRGPRTITGDYASAVVRRFFDVRSPVAQRKHPRSYVILQCINLGHLALPGNFGVTVN